MRENMMSSLKILKKGEEVPTLRLIAHNKEIRIKKSSPKKKFIKIIYLENTLIPYYSYFEVIYKKSYLLCVVLNVFCLYFILNHTCFFAGFLF